MFLHVSVILSTGGWLSAPGGGSAPEGGRRRCLLRGCLLPEGCLLPGGGYLLRVGVPGPGGVMNPPPPQATATAADGTHPTEMHSCIHS